MGNPRYRIFRIARQSAIVDANSKLARRIPSRHQMTHTSRTRIGTLAATLLLAACSGDNGVEPRPAPINVDAALSEMSLPALTNAASVSWITPVAALTSASGCNYDAGSSSFVCPTMTAAGLTLTRSFTLLDGSGNPQQSYDRTTTAAIRTTSSAVGTVTDAGTSLHIDQHETMTLSGLLSGVHTLNGVANATMTGNDSYGHPETLTVLMTTADVVLPNSTGPNAYPKSGTMTLAANNATGTLTSAFQFQIAFNGTSKVPVTISMDGLPVQHCIVDLASPDGLTCS